MKFPVRRFRTISWKEVKLAENCRRRCKLFVSIDCSRCFDNMLQPWTKISEQTAEVTINEVVFLN